MKVSELKNILSAAPDDYDVYVNVGACYMDGTTVSIDNDDHSVIIDYEGDENE